MKCTSKDSRHGHLQDSHSCKASAYKLIPAGSAVEAVLIWAQAGQRSPSPWNVPPAPRMLREKGGNKGWVQTCSSITCQQFAVPIRGLCASFHPVPAPCVPMKSMSCAGPGAGLCSPCVSLPRQGIHNSVFLFQLTLEGPFRSTNQSCFHLHLQAVPGFVHNSCLQADVPCPSIDNAQLPLKLFLSLLPCG